MAPTGGFFGRLTIPLPKCRKMEEAIVMQADNYLLGRAEAEEARLRRQIANLAPDSEAQFDMIGIKPGERVVDLGCGPGGVLHLLAKRVGRTGSVLGIDRSRHFVELARRFAVEEGLPQIEVREGDAYDTGLPRASFDGAHMRLVLVNVPEPDRIVREAVSLVRPGGWVASFEADYLPHSCDPPLPAWTRLVDAYSAYAAAQGIDLFLGRRTHRLFRDAGVTDIRVDAVVHLYPPGHERRPILRDFIINVRDKLLNGGFITRAEIERDIRALEDHLSNPEVLVTSHIFYRMSGRLPS
jgi:SAM-dependent methyltransferase